MDQLSRLVMVDLDGTLTDRLTTHRKEIAIVAKYGVNEKTYEKGIEELIKRHGNNYAFRNLLPILLETNPNLPLTLLDELESLLDEKVFFEDAQLFLFNFPKEQLIIVSSGDYETQKRKYNAHGLGDFVTGFIVSGDKGETIDMLTQIVGKKIPLFFIDDTPRQLDIVKRKNPDVTCIQVHEPLHWETQKECRESGVIKLPTLIEAAEFIHGRLKI